MNSDLRERLAAIEAELADAAMQKLRAAVDGDENAALDERKITRARRAVAKAMQLLDGGADDDFDEF
ncbi:MAG TPA: hypothetical protein VMZ22_07345 [Acidimicrobiales bacterium]|nr:hypothetical protein [Acidimicrobiales bacterium]